MSVVCRPQRVAYNALERNRGKVAFNICLGPRAISPRRGITQPLEMANGRHVINQEIGTVGMLNDFSWLEASRVNGATLNSNMFYIVGGRGGNLVYLYEYGLRC